MLSVLASSTHASVESSGSLDVGRGRAFNATWPEQALCPAAPTGARRAKLLQFGSESRRARRYVLRRLAMGLGRLAQSVMSWCGRGLSHGSEAVQRGGLVGE